MFISAYKDGMKYGSGTLIPSRIRVYWKCISRFYLLFENKVEIFFSNNLLLCFIYLSCFFLSLVFFSFFLVLFPPDLEIPCIFWILKGFRYGSLWILYKCVFESEGDLVRSCSSCHLFVGKVFRRENRS